MKRTLSGDLSPNPSPTGSNNGATNNRDQNQQQQANANRQRAPAMQAPAANDPPPANPLFGLDVDTPLPDWEEFAQMLPHTPPVENRRAASEEEASSVSDDEYTTEESSAEEPSRDFEEGIGTKSSAGLKPEQDTIVVNRSSVRELTEILDICKRNPQITALQINPPMNSQLPLKALEKLIEFFSNHQSIRELRLYLNSTGKASIQPKQLTALIQSSGLNALSIHGVDLMSPSPEDSEEFFDGIKRNSSLEILDLFLIRNSQLVAGIIEAMAEGHTLKQLDLTTMNLKGLENSIVRLLTSNTNFRALKIVLHSHDCLDEVERLFESIANNHTLEALHFGGSGFELDLIGKNLLKLLALNQSLKEIRFSDPSIMTDKAAAAITELINTHPTLTSIDIGRAPGNHHARMLIAQALKSNPRIKKFAAESLAFVSMNTGDSVQPQHVTEFLNTIGDCPSLTALQLVDLSELDCLIKFLETHPQISEIDLPMDWIPSIETQEKLLALVRAYPHIKTLTIFNTPYLSQQARQFRKELGQALAINREVGSDKRMTEASVAMKTLLDKKSMTDEELPFVPLDVTNELTKAIARHLPSTKAKAIFDELILHAEKHH
jgi:hypothetical protein